MQIGYARVSTLDQDAGLDGQVRDLEASGCERIFSERISSIAVKRPQLMAALDFVRDGDVLVITKLDRLARSTEDLLALVRRLDTKGVGLIVLSMGGGLVDSRTATGKLMLTMLGAVAEFERGLMLERQREGIAKAKAEGKYKGRAPTARAKAGEIIEMRNAGLKPAAIVAELNVSRASVYRMLRAETP